jgi:hypothetical protein
MLESVQGRKQVVLLSAGFDSSVLGGAQGQEAAQTSQASVEGRLWDVQSERYFGDSSARQKLDELFNTLAVSDTVIHSVDVTGLAAFGQVDEAVPGWRPGQGRDTLAQFAANSGGRFIKDANDLKAGLAEVLDASSHYYVLAFEPADMSKRDRLRKLKLKVLRPGLEVSHRRGYVLPGPKRELDAAARQLQAAEAIAKGLSGGPLALRAVAVPYRSAKGRVSLPVVLEIDGRALLGSGSSKEKELRLEVYGYALDGQGRIHDAVALSPTLVLAEVKPALEAKGLQVLTAFSVPPGTADLRFLVRETASGRAGSLRMALEVPAFGTGQIVLSPPLAMDDPRTRLVLPAASRALPALEIPFRLEDTPFTAEPLPVLHNGAGRDVCVIVWSGSARYAGAALEVEAQLVDAANAPHGLRLEGAPRVVADADGLQRYVLRVLPAGMAPGRYSLRVGFKNAATSASAIAQSPVQVQ